MGEGPVISTNTSTLLSALALALTYASAKGEIPPFKFYDLGELICGSNGGTANGINDLGMVVGRKSSLECDSAHAMIWHNGVVLDLDATSDGENMHDGNSISGNGVVVFGQGHDGELVVFWRDGFVTGIGPPPECSSNGPPQKMNDIGTIGVGDCFGVPAVYGINDLSAQILDPLPGTPPGNPGWANDVNDTGIVVGHFQFDDPQGLRAYYWQDGVMTELVNTVGGVLISAYGISNSGYITGAAETSNGIEAYRYDMRTAEMVAFAADAGYEVNDRGDVAGWYNFEGMALHAMFFRDGEWKDLVEYLPYYYWHSTALGMNSYGWIVGEAWEDIEFRYWGWLLVPIYDKGDYDGDEDVDLHDFGHFQECFAAEPYQGPEGGLHVGCSVFDFDDDVDLDLTDFAAFQSAFTGPITSGW